MVAEKAGNDVIIGGISHKIGLLYFKTGEYEKAIEKHFKYIERIPKNTNTDADKIK